MITTSTDRCYSVMLHIYRILVFEHFSTVVDFEKVD